MHSRQFRHPGLDPQVPRLATHPGGILCVVLTTLLLAANPLRAEAVFLSPISSLAPDRHTTREPGQGDTASPVHKQRSGKQLSLRAFIARDNNPNHAFNYLWLRNFAGKKRLLAQGGFFGGALHAGVRLFRNKRLSGDLYYVEEAPDAPPWVNTKYWLGMSTDQVRFRVRYHF